MTSVVRLIMVMIGFVALAVGVVGIFVPLLPTVPFLLLAAACFVRGSVRLHDRLMSHPVLGQIIRDFRSGSGVPRHVKVRAVILTGVSVGVSLTVLLLHLSGKR